MKKETTNRRKFIKASTAAVAAGSVAFPTVTFGKPDSRKLKIGFIGCGGRGTGAAAQALHTPRWRRSAAAHVGGCGRLNNRR